MTLDRTIRLLCSALGQGPPSLERAILLVEYFVRRNEVARASHEKTWRQRHPGLIFVLL